MIQTKFQSCIEACLDCVAICNQCAIACLNEKEVAHLKKCIQLNLECVAICQAAANILSLDGKFSKDIANFVWKCATLVLKNVKNMLLWEWSIVENVPKLVENVLKLVKK